MSARLQKDWLVGFEVVAIHFETAREISRVFFPVEHRSQIGSTEWTDSLWAARGDAAAKSRVCGSAYVAISYRGRWKNGTRPGRLIVFRFGQEVSQGNSQLWLPLGPLCESSAIAFEKRVKALTAGTGVPATRGAPGTAGAIAARKGATHGHQGKEWAA
jgi:hypothetical protein